MSVKLEFLSGTSCAVSLPVPATAASRKRPLDAFVSAKQLLESLKLHDCLLWLRCDDGCAILLPDGAALVENSCYLVTYQKVQAFFADAAEGATSVIAFFAASASPTPSGELVNVAQIPVLVQALLEARLCERLSMVTACQFWISIEQPSRVLLEGAHDSRWMEVLGPSQVGFTGTASLFVAPFVSSAKSTDATFKRFTEEQQLALLACQQGSIEWLAARRGSFLTASTARDVQNVAAFAAKFACFQFPSQTRSVRVKADFEFGHSQERLVQQLCIDLLFPRVFAAAQCTHYTAGTFCMVLLPPIHAVVPPGA